MNHFGKILLTATAVLLGSGCLHALTAGNRTGALRRGQHGDGNAPFPR